MTLQFVMWQLLAVILGWASFAASLYLLIWLCKLRGTLAKKLMARQLLHLALADTLQAAVVAPKFVLALLHSLFDVGLNPSAALDDICLFAHLDNIPYMTSVFVEVHIALATVFSIFHCSVAVAALSRILPFVWVFGCILGGAVVGLGTVSWDPKVGNCNPQLRGEYLRVVIMAGALAICIATYLAGIVTGRRRAGESVRGRQQNHALLFVAAAVVTWLPFVVFMFSSRSSANYIENIENHKNRVGFYLVSVFMSANGLFNAAVYALKSGFVRRTLRRDKELDSSARLPAMRSATPGSFNVMFNEDSEVVSVPAVTATANRRAERQTAALVDGALVDGTPESFSSSNGEAEFLACFDVAEQMPDN